MAGSDASATSAEAACGVVSPPTGAAPGGYVYYPSSEELNKEEIRVIDCGTGLTAARRRQAANYLLIETGNGDKFLIDLGTGSMANIIEPDDSASGSEKGVSQPSSYRSHG